LNRELYTPSFIRLLLSNLFFWMSTNLLVPTIPVHFHNLGYPASAIGAIIGFFALGAVLFRIPSGRWVDRYGSTKVLGTGIIIAGLSLLLLLFSKSTELILLARFIHGASITGFSAAALTINSVMHKSAHQNEAVGAFTLFIMIGNGIAFSSSLFLYRAFDFSTVAGIGFLATILTFLLFPKNIIPPNKSKNAPPISIPEVAKNPGVWIPSICQFGSNFAYGALFAFVPLLFERANASGLTYYYIAYAIAVVLTRIFVARILTFMPSTRLLGLLLYGFGITLACTLIPPGPFSSILLGLLIGFTYGIAFPALIPIVANHTHLNERGTAFGVFTVSVDIGAATGSIFLGVLLDYIPFNPVFIMSAAILMGLGFLYRTFLQPKLEKAPEIHETPTS